VGIYTPKSVQVDFLWDKMTSEWLLNMGIKFYTSPKILYTQYGPENNNKNDNNVSGHWGPVPRYKKGASFTFKIPLTNMERFQ